MNYEDLDKDTKNLIEILMTNTEKTKEQAISELVEFGMLAMVSAVCKDPIRKKISDHILDNILPYDGLLNTAMAYRVIWREE